MSLFIIVIPLFYFKVVTVAIHFITAACLIMNWIPVLCVAAFLSCQYSIGHGVPGGITKLTSKEFNNRYYQLVKPEIEEEMGCDCLKFTYLQGTFQVCITLTLSLLSCYILQTFVGCLKKILKM